MSGGILEFHRIAAIAIGGALLLSLASLSGRSAGHPRADTDAALRTARDEAVLRNSRPLMGTTFNLSVWAPVARHPEAAETLLAALDRIATLEKQISSWDPDSETSAVNRLASEESVRVSEPLQELIAVSRDWSRRTCGAFDVTGGPLFDLWADARQQGQLPTAEEIDAALRRVGYEKLTLANDSAQLSAPGMKISFGAVGKGFAADCAAAFLRARGFDNFVIDAGGDVLVSGSKGKQAWSIAIRHPRREAFLAVLDATDCAVATSGDYEQFTTIDGNRLSHIIDPRTGWPTQESVSVTVITRRAVDADALATAVSVMPPDQGLAFIDELRDTEAILARKDGGLLFSDGLRLRGDQLVVVP